MADKKRSHFTKFYNAQQVNLGGIGFCPAYQHWFGAQIWHIPINSYKGNVLLSAES